MFCYDVGNQKSYQNIKNWVVQAEQKANKNCAKVLLGNKCDLQEREVDYRQGEKTAKECNMEFFETSAKYNININEAFGSITSKILKNNLSKIIPQLSMISDNSTSSMDRNKCSC